MNKAEIVFEKIGGKAKAGKNVLDRASMLYKKLQSVDLPGKAKIVGETVGKTTAKVQKAGKEGYKAFKKQTGNLDSKVKGLWADTRALPTSFKAYKKAKPGSRKAKKALDQMYSGAVIPGVAAGTMATGAGIVAMGK